MRGYVLPPGHTQISFSGGRSSAYMLHQILGVNGDFDPERVQVVFANTGLEHPGTLDFVQECSHRWGVPITWVEDADRIKGQPIFDIVDHNSASRNGEPFRRLVKRKKAVPNQNQRFCTENLKMLPARRYLKSIGWKQWTNALGMRADERQRHKPSTDKRIKRWFPLGEDVYRELVDEFWRNHSFDLNIPEGRGNCQGCFLKSEKSLATIARTDPEHHAIWEQMEEDVGATFRSTYSRKELRNFVTRQGDWILDDDNDLLCQKNDGECTI